MNQINNRILIVDDNPTIREDFRRILSPSDCGEGALAAVEAELFDEVGLSQQSRPDFQLAFASQGESAAQLVSTAIEQGCPFAVAIVDIRMPPGIDGVQTVKQLWRMQSDLQIVLCTAYSEYSWEQIVQQLGISHRLVVLKKPFDPIEVMQLCHAMTNKWSTERAMAIRQLELQNKLNITSQRAEKVCSELLNERKERQRMGNHQTECVVMDTMSGLAAGIAHDFNNALTVIQGHISAALMDPGYSASMEIPLEQILQATQRASNLSRQMMALTSEADAPSEMRVINLIPLVEQQAAMIQRALRDRVHVSVYHSDDEIFVLSADTHIHRLVNAICLCAGEQMSRGGRMGITIKKQLLESLVKAGEPQVKRDTSEYCVIQLDDNSLTAEASHESIQRLQQDIAQKQDSPRIQLARNLAEQLGGWITIEMCESVGCRHSVILPLADKCNATYVSSPGTIETKETSLVVLVVDDEPTVCDIIAYVLTRQGHRVIKANHALEAWTSWQEEKHQIDLLIADLYLPDGMTGFELARHMRADRANLPVIYMSGYHPELFVNEEKLTLGLNYLSKPFDVLDLLNAVGRSLESSDSISTVRQQASSLTPSVTLSH